MTWDEYDKEVRTGASGVGGSTAGGPTFSTEKRSAEMSGRPSVSNSKKHAGRVASVTDIAERATEAYIEICRDVHEKAKEQGGIPLSVVQWVVTRTLAHPLLSDATPNRADEPDSSP